MLTTKRVKFLKDVIHNEIVFDSPWVMDILQTPEFIRLSRIKQTGLIYYLYPNATHTRTAHSLGTYFLARRLAKQLGCFKESEKQELYAAALLHDIGHGPHSHSFENYTGVCHEGFSKELITNPVSNINKILKKYKINTDNVVAILDHKHKNELLNDIISSQIDVDRMDYLARDSHFTGVSFGHIDTSVLIRWIHVHEGKLVFTFKAISSIENFLLSRYHMYKQVYEQPKIIAVQQLVSQMLGRFKVLYQQNPKQLVDHYHMSELYKPWLLDKEFSLEQYVKLDDTNFETFIAQMEFEKDPYIKEAFKVYSTFSSKNYKIVECNAKNIKKYKAHFLKKTKFPDLYMHECAELTKPIYKTDSQPILVYDDFTKQVKKLDEVSPIIKALKDAVKPQIVLVVDNNI